MVTEQSVGATLQSPSRFRLLAYPATPDYSSAVSTGGDIPRAEPMAAVDPGLTFSGTSPQTASPFSPISYAPVSITDMVAPSGGAGINPLYLIIGIVALIGIAAYFMVKK